MSRRLYRRGDQVRLTVPTMSGWQGDGVVTADQEPDDFTVTFTKVGADLDDSDRASFAHWSELELIECSTGDGSTGEESL